MHAVGADVLGIHAAGFGVDFAGQRYLGPQAGETKAKSTQATGTQVDHGQAVENQGLVMQAGLVDRLGCPLDR